MYSEAYKRERERRAPYESVMALVLLLTCLVDHCNEHRDAAGGRPVQNDDNIDGEGGKDESLCRCLSRLIRRFNFAEQINLLQLSYVATATLNIAVI